MCPVARLYTALLVRNEAGEDRYLRRVLARCVAFSDAVLVLDDNSTDDTATIAASMGCVVRTRQGNPAWGEESSARRELWDFACEYAVGQDDWILVCDADMELHGDPRPLAETTELNAWAWPLFDLWDSETTYRSDNFWRGHEFPRVWMVAPNRVPEGWVADWGERGVHCGHIPLNFPLIAGNSPISVYWAHLGWKSLAHRELKVAQYASVAHQLSPFERAHVASILEPQDPS